MKNRSAFLAVIFFVMLVYGVGCNSQEEIASSYVDPTPTDTIAEAPSISAEPTWSNCPYDVEPIATALEESYNRVLNNMSGNIHLLVELEAYMVQAESIVEDPRCETDVRSSGLNQYLNMAKTAKNLGQKRLDATLGLAEDLLDFSYQIMDSNNNP